MEAKGKRQLCEDNSRDWSPAAKSKEYLGPPDPERILPESFLEEHSPVNTLTF